jgi:multidrug efflux pump subunit AcrB
VQLVPRLEQAADMRLDTRQLGYMVDCLVDGGYATDYYLENDRIDLVIKGDERFVKRTQDLRTLPVITPGGQLVPLDVKWNFWQQKILETYQNMHQLLLRQCPAYFRS